MELIALLEAMREGYILQYESVYRDKIEIHEQVTPEVTFEISGGVYKQLFTVDFLFQDGEDILAGEVLEADAVSLAQHSFSYNDIAVSLEPVTWDAMTFTLSPAPDALIGFEIWFDRWMDIDGEHQPDGEPFSHVIHSATLDGNTIAIDFGTAPIEASLELFDLFSQNGVDTVHVWDSREAISVGSS